MNTENAKSQMRKGMLEYCMLKYEWQESTQGPPRKYYALTLDGEEFLRHLDSAWNELTNTVNILHNGSEVVISHE